MSAYKYKFKADEVNIAAFIARAAKLKVLQDCLDRAQALAIKNLKCLDRHVSQDLSASHKEMECQR
jgi:hypothetical protein